MLILGFESSCDETSAAVVRTEEGGRFTVLSNIVASQIPIHRKYGGVVPEIASRAHVEAISSITREALRAASLTIHEIDLIAVTSHPGLIGALLIALNFAKGLASAYGKPLVGVNHIHGHVAACYLGEGETPIPKPPYLALVVSGGHTSIYHVRSYTELCEIGATRDDAMGEAFDKIGRIIGIPYPAGADFDKLAAEGYLEVTGKEGASTSEYKRALGREPEFRLPSPALAGDTLDFSFSGLKTAAINLLHKLDQRGEELPRARFAAAYTAEAVEAAATKVSAALSRYPQAGLAVAGGVAANSHLQRRLAEVARERGVPLYIPKPSLCGDNAAMIAAAGYYEYLAGRVANSALNASALDEPLI